MVKHWIMPESCSNLLKKGKLSVVSLNEVMLLLKKSCIAVLLEPVSVR